MNHSKFKYVTFSRHQAQEKAHCVSDDWLMKQLQSKEIQNQLKRSRT